MNGLITVSAGLVLMVFGSILDEISDKERIQLLGIIEMIIGAALFIFGIFLIPPT